MKNASEIMYKIGKIINIIMIPVSVLLLVIGAVLIATTPVSTEMTPEELQKIASASTCIGYGVYFLITSVLSIESIGLSKDNFIFTSSPFLKVWTSGEIVLRPKE